MIDVVLRLAIVLGVGGLAVAGSYRAARRSISAATVLAAVGLALVLLQYADPRFDLDHHVWLPSGLLRDLLFAPGALLIGVAFARARDGRRQRVLTLLLTLGYAFFTLHDPLYVLATAPGNLTPADPVVKDGVVLQRNDRNCLPASAATVLRRWNVGASDGDLAVRMQTSYYGTLEHRALVALRDVGAPIGLDAVLVRTTWDELRAIDHPCLLLVRLVNETPHAVALLGMTPERVVIGEPLVGLQTFEPAVFESWKRWSGDAILVGRDLRHDLGRGDRAAVVRRARAALDLPGDDLLDEALERRVREFQAARRLPETGRLEPKTLLALWAVLDRGQVPSLNTN